MHRLPFALGRQLCGAAQRLVDYLQRQQFEAFAGIATGAPGLAAHGLQLLGACALPRLAEFAIERVETRHQRLGQNPQQAGIAAATVATLDPQQRQQGIQAQPAFRGLAEHMQAIANLRFLQVAQVGVQARQPHRGIVQLAFQLQFAVDVVGLDQFENVALQLAGAPRVEQLGLVELVGQLLQVAQRAIGFGTGQRRHQVVDDHRLGAALGLGTLARVVDDERVDVRQRAEQGVRPALCRQPDALAGQPFEVAVLADMDHRVGGKGMAQPEVKRQVAVRRHQVRIVVHRAGVHLVTPRRLNADEGQAKAQAGHHQPATAVHRVLLRRPPTLQHSLAVGLWQALEGGLVVGQAQALRTGAQVQMVEVVGHAAEQLVDQLRATARQVGQRIAFGLQGLENVQRRRWRVQANAVANAAIPGRVVGQHQGHALLRIRQARQLDPAAGQFGDKVHALGVGAVADHVGLAALAAPGHVLETDRAGDDAPVQFGQGNVHGQVTRPQALLAGFPAGLVVLRADGLQHRDVATERAQVGAFGAGQGKAGGVDQHFGPHLVQPGFDLLQAGAFL